MKTRFPLVALAALLIFAPACAEEQIVGGPGPGLRIRFNAPQHITVASPAKAAMGIRADRIQLTFLISPPYCLGDDTDENIYDCFSKKLKKSPRVIWETERGNTVPNGVQVMYMARIDEGKSFNIHLLFARNGQWGNVHASVASPTKEDITMLAAVVDSIVIEDDTPAGK